MNDIEHQRWLEFQRKYKNAEKLYREYHGSGIGDKIVAVAKYGTEYIKEDISD